MDWAKSPWTSSEAYERVESLAAAFDRKLDSGFIAPAALCSTPRMEPWPFGAYAAIGKIGTFVEERIDVRCRNRRAQQHVLDDGAFGGVQQRRAPKNEPDFRPDLVGFGSQGDRTGQMAGEPGTFAKPAIRPARGMAQRARSTAEELRTAMTSRVVRKVMASSKLSASSIFARAIARCESI